MIEPERVSLQMSDGYRVQARWWPGEANAQPVVYLHGIQSHGGWFLGSASYLAQAGLPVLMPDRRGSGENPLQRGHAESAGRLLDDVVEQIRWACQSRGDSRAHLVGVSWGGKLALAAHQRAPGEVASLSLVAPGLFPKVDVGVGTKMAVALASVFQRRRQYDIPLNDPKLFTTNPGRLEYIRNDPKRLRSATASLLLASKRLDRATHKARAAPSTTLNLYLAEQDDIIDTERTKTWARSLPWSDRRITQYPASRHTLEFEPDPTGFFADLLAGISG